MKRLILSFCFAMVLSFELPSTAAEVIHYQVVKSFGGVPNDGASPWTSLAQGADGALYGTTYMGGSNNAGIFYKMNLDGSGYAVLHHFGTGASTTGDGRNPLCDLTTASDGQLYGTTLGGGSGGGGTVFKMHTDGSGYTILRSFLVGSGGELNAGLIEGSDGVLYGTFTTGPFDTYAGAVFAMNKDGTGYRLLHRFGPYNSNDGLQPLAPVMEGSDHVLYGTTSTGGGSAVGSIFKVNRDGSGYQKLYAFDFGGGVINPFAGLLEGSDHALYGTGGGGGGGVFKLNKDGTGYQVLVGFNGDRPYAALARSRDGALYSTTYMGGTAGYGRVFRINEDGSGYQILHNFGGAAADGYPDGH